MVHLTRIYTKTGDDGTTSLGDMSRTSKNDPRLEAYATVDEANSYIGVVLTVETLNSDVRKLLVRIQNDLFDVGADLCTPVIDAPAHEPLRVLESQISYLEEQIDKYNAELEPLRSFVLPSGTLIDSSQSDADDQLRIKEPEIYAGLIALRNRIVEKPQVVEKIKNAYSIKNTMGYGLNSFVDFEKVKLRLFKEFLPRFLHK